jgi:GNAT superfamily N-acetyltransferase
VKNNILVRGALVDDAEAVAGVMIAAMRSAFDGLVPQHCLEWPDSAADWKKSLTNGLGEGVFLDVAQAEDGRVVGYVMGRPRQGDPLYPGEVLHIHVLPNYQGQGIGGLLVRHTAKRLALQGIHSLCVKVLCVNPNRRFYERLGGEYVCEKPYDWDGVIFSECMYGWKDTQRLVDGS